MSDDSIYTDSLIVGAGPAGLAAAIRLKQLKPDHEVIIIEKAPAAGAHTLSGAVIDATPLKMLCPNQSFDHLLLACQKEQLLYLGNQWGCALPIPARLKNTGCYLVRLGYLVKELAEIAEQLGVQIFYNTAGVKLLIDNNHLVGIKTDDKGRDSQGQPLEHFSAGIELYAKQTLLAEGCRGSLAEQAIKHFKLNDGCLSDPTYGLGVKELWQVDHFLHQPGTIIHTLGWPLPQKCFGGGFMYHLNDGLLAVGFVTALDYQQPTMDPYQNLQQFKQHRSFKALFAHGKRIGYGARAIAEGGWQSLPSLQFNGGYMLGDSAGLLDVSRLKGVHHALQSGMEVADCIIHQQNYNQRIKQGEIGKSLYQIRNVRAHFQQGVVAGLLLNALDYGIFRGYLPWTRKHRDDAHSLTSQGVKKINYPAADNVMSFDKLNALYLSNVSHRENQPNHLQITSMQTWQKINLAQFQSPESAYCPAAVYEVQQQKLVINASNCLHCKACDIKDDNIRWTPPEGGGGPIYDGM